MAAAKKVSLRSYVDKLARCDSPLTEEKWDVAFHTRAEMPAGYVWPEIHIDSPPKNPHALLVTAPGAMGKTAASRAIAAYLKCPLINLARLPVGSDSLTGLLTRVLGWSQAATFIQNLHNGTATIVLDSVDEAQLLAGQEHFQAFLRNIGELVSATQPSQPTLVILGRRDAAETTMLELDDAGVRCVQAEICALDLRRSEAFISAFLDNNPIRGALYNVHNTNPEPFSKLRESVFSDIAGALLGEDDIQLEDRWPDVAGFMGYPPVLMSLASWLAVDNPSTMTLHATHDDGKRAQTKPAERGEILKEVVEQILDREHEKVAEKMALVFQVNLTDPICDIVYTREEQVLRVLRYLRQDANLRIEAPASLSPQHRASYDAHLDAFVPDHPFLAGREFANVVFQDYVRAFLDTSPTIHSQTADSLRSIVSVLDVGPFYCHFTAALLLSDPNDPRRYLDTEDHLDDLLRSFTIGARGTALATYVHVAEVGEITLLEVDAAEQNVTAGLAFTVSTPSGVLELRSPIAHLFVITSNGIVVSSRTNELEIGPNVMIVADHLQFTSDRIVVRAASEGTSDEAGGSMLISKTAEHRPDVKVTSFPSDALRINWKEPWHQWLPYLQPAPAADGQIPSAVSWQILIGLRRIMTAFHRRAQGDPSIVWERMSGFTLGHNPLLAALLDGLIELNVVSRSVDRVHVLNLAKLAEYGIGYHALWHSDLSKTFGQLHSAVAKTESVQRYLAVSG